LSLHADVSRNKHLVKKSRAKEGTDIFEIQTANQGQNEVGDEAIYSSTSYSVNI
jgi:hypothetical protein